MLALWQITHDERYRNAAILLRKQLDTQPRTRDGGFWHKQRYPHQMWLDGLYMAEPFYAEYAKLFNEPADFDDVAKQIRLADEHTYNPKTGLFYHGWDESKSQPWADQNHRHVVQFLGARDGLVCHGHGGCARLFSDESSGAAGNHRHVPKIMRGRGEIQDPQTGLWWQVVDQGHRKGNYLEATASSMFVYAMAKGINHGYLPRNYEPAVLKGYRGIIENLIRDDGDGRWSLTHCCSVAGLGYGRDGSFEYYVSEPVVDNDLKGVGPFILAGIEVQQLTGPIRPRHELNKFPDAKLRMSVNPYPRLYENDSCLYRTFNRSGRRSLAGLTFLIATFCRFASTTEPVSTAFPMPRAESTLTASLSSAVKPYAVLTAMQRVADWQLAHPATNRPPAGLRLPGTRA